MSAAHLEKAFEAIVNSMWEDYQNTGGSSRDYVNAIPTEGFMVSRSGSEIVIEKDKFSKEDIRDAFFDIFMEIKCIAYFGIWSVDDLVYLDISDKYDNVVDAFRAAVKHKQLAIYNVETGHSIRLDLVKPLKGQANRGGIPNWSVGDIYPLGIVGIGFHTWELWNYADQNAVLDRVCYVDEGITSKEALQRLSDTARKIQHICS